MIPEVLFALISIITSLGVGTTLISIIMETASGSAKAPTGVIIIVSVVLIIYVVLFVAAAVIYVKKYKKIGLLYIYSWFYVMCEVYVVVNRYNYTIWSAHETMSAALKVFIIKAIILFVIIIIYAIKYIFKKCIKDIRLRRKTE